MHYKLGSGVIIKTENAAKPEKQLSSFLKQLILKLPSVSASVDYGCGKLRYTETILKTTDTLTLVDSDVQISRQQVLRGKFSNIKSIAHSSNRLNAYNTTEFGQLTSTFDRAFCINVLSVIPLFSVRRRARYKCWLQNPRLQIKRRQRLLAGSIAKSFKIKNLQD